MLEDIRSGSLEIDEAMKQLTLLPFEDLGFAKVDHHRSLRKGFPEVVLGQGKTDDQIEQIVNSMAGDGTPVLVTRTTEEVYKRLESHHSDITFHPASGMIVVNEPERNTLQGLAVVVSAGTSDQRVAEEAAVTARSMGCQVEMVQDVGVAGIHRLLNHAELLHSATVIIVVAGMDGALPSAVGGMVSAPVIAVPTSVGYGASFGGISALLTMLNSCASGVTVVNIDNGFGAGYFAGLLLKKLS